jgi:hypothetical protein
MKVYLNCGLFTPFNYSHTEFIIARLLAQTVAIPASDMKLLRHVAGISHATTCF